MSHTLETAVRWSHADHRDRPYRSPRWRLASRSVTATPSSWGPPTVPSPVRVSTSSRSPSTSRSGCTRPARSPAASSSARRDRPKRPSWPPASRTGRSGRCSPRGTRTTSSASSPSSPRTRRTTPTSSARSPRRRPSRSVRSRSSARSRPSGSAASTVSSSSTRRPPSSSDSELDLIVSGTRDAIMMVEAGVKLLTEDVMAEAILFGHRSLQPIIDLQEELQKLVGKAKQVPYIEPGTESVLDFVAKVQANDEFVVVDTETTGTDPKMADLVEIAAVRVKGGKITDKWSTLVNPGRSIMGHQIHGITDKDVLGRPVAQGRGRDLPLVRRQGDDRRPLDRLRPRLHRGGQGRRLPLRPGQLPRHVRARPGGLPGLQRELQALGPGQVLRHRASSPATAPCRTPRRPPSSCSMFAGDLPNRIETLHDGIAGSIRAYKKDGPTRRASSRRPAARPA